VEAASASLRVPATLRSTEDIANIHAAIVESEFLQRYSYTQLASLCRACELREIKPGETLFGEGDVGDHFFVLIKGAVDVYKEFLGQGRKCVATLHDSGSFGELALLRVTNKQTNKRARSASRPWCAWLAPSASSTAVHACCTHRTYAEKQSARISRRSR
jgi:hypothetical protein